MAVFNGAEVVLCIINSGTVVVETNITIITRLILLVQSTVI